MATFTSYRILPDLGLILSNFQGKIKIGDVIQTNLQFISDKEYDSSYDLIMDFSDSIAIAYRMDLMEFVEFFKKSVKLKKRVRIGMIISSPNQNYLLDLYKPIANLLKMDVECFSDIDPCLTWLGYTENEQQIVKSNFQHIKDVQSL
jgi:hypothetical protein